MNIKGEYKYSDDFKSDYSNGVVGGFRTPNEIFLNFYTESVTLPKNIEINVDEITHVATENGIRASQFTRTITSQVIMSKENAIKLRDWLIDNIDKVNKKKQDDPNNDGPSTVNISGLFN